MSDAEDTGVDPELAAQMGFSSFGAAPRASKKRRVDASVAAPVPTQHGSNPDEIALDDDDDEPRPAARLPERSAAETLHHSLPPRPEVQPPQYPDHNQQQQQQQQQHRGRDHRHDPHQSATLPDGSWNWNALKYGVLDDAGDVAYYDPSFVEDPWAKLITDDKSPENPAPSTT